MNRVCRISKENQMNSIIAFTRNVSFSSSCVMVPEKVR